MIQDVFQYMERAKLRLDEWPDDDVPGQLVFVQSRREYLDALFGDRAEVLRLAAEATARWIVSQREWRAEELARTQQRKDQAKRRKGEKLARLHRRAMKKVARAFALRQQIMEEQELQAFRAAFRSRDD